MHSSTAGPTTSPGSSLLLFAELAVEFLPPGSPGWSTYVLWTFGGLGMGLALLGTVVLILRPCPFH